MSTNARRGAAISVRAPIEFHEMPGARHFRAADLASWRDAQRRYRELVHHRHPDRRPKDADATAHAEFIEITAAFKRLRERYRHDGVLPGARRPPPVGANVAAAANDPRVPRRPARTPSTPVDELALWRTGPGRSAGAGESRVGATSARGRRARTVLATRTARTAVGIGMALATLMALAGLGLALEAGLERSNRDLERSLQGTR